MPRPFPANRPVLVDDEKHPDAFEDTVSYVFHNPQRAGLVSDWQQWPCLGVIVPGFPDLPHAPLAEFWRRFRKVHYRECSRIAP